MKCSKCGSDIPSGMMFCPQCGHAVQMVPDFDIDRDEGIAVSSDDVQDALSKLLDADGNRRMTDDTVRLPGVKGRVKLFQRAAMFTCIALLIVVILLIVVFFVRSKRGNLDTAIDNARQAYEEGDYKDAVTDFEKAMMIARDKDLVVEINDQISLADSLQKTGRSNDAISVLKKVLEIDPENMGAYELLINVLKDNGKYEEINRLIAGNTDSDIYSKYVDYLTIPPDFDRAAGDYNEEFDLSLSSEYGGDIYYTLDGTVPDSSSELYLQPLHIGEGDTIVTAVCINAHDMASPPVKMKYSIEFDAPGDPEVSPESGNFSQPQYITATVSDPNIEKVCYTLDGSDPTADSEVYEHMIPMNLGKSTVKFLAFSDKGVSGNVIERNYGLNVQGVCSSEDATNYVTASLVATGAMSDIYGNAPGVKGHYKFFCTRAAKEGSRTYYIIDEYLEDGSGVLTKTDKAYAVDVISCMMYRVDIKPDGRYGFTLFY